MQEYYGAMLFMYNKDDGYFLLSHALYYKN